MLKIRSITVVCSDAIYPSFDFFQINLLCKETLLLLWKINDYAPYFCWKLQLTQKKISLLIFHLFVMEFEGFYSHKTSSSLKEGCDLCTSLTRIGIAFYWMNYAVNSIIEQKWLITILLTIFHGITIGIIKCSQFIFEWKINATRPILMSFA